MVDIAITTDDDLTTEVIKHREVRIQWCEQGHRTSGSTDLVAVQRNPINQPKMVCRPCSKVLSILGWRILPF